MDQRALQLMGAYAFLQVNKADVREMAEFPCLVHQFAKGKQ